MFATGFGDSEDVVSSGVVEARPGMRCGASITRKACWGAFDICSLLGLTSLDMVCVSLVTLAGLPGGKRGRRGACKARYCRPTQLDTLRRRLMGEWVGGGGLLAFGSSSVEGVGVDLGSSGSRDRSCEV
jgi:hypothetical protein